MHSGFLYIIRVCCWVPLCSVCQSACSCAHHLHYGNITVRFHLWKSNFLITVFPLENCFGHSSTFTLTEECQRQFIKCPKIIPIGISIVITSTLQFNLESTAIFTMMSSPPGTYNICPFLGYLLNHSGRSFTLLYKALIQLCLILKCFLVLLLLRTKSFL